MKKTLLALAMPAALAAGSANAAINVYNSNGVTVDIGGSAEVQYFKRTDEALDPTLRIDDGDFFINTTAQVAPGLNAVAGIGFYFESDGNAAAEVKSDELYVGMSSDFGTLTIGRQWTIVDGIGNDKDYEVATALVGYGDTLSSRVIKWTVDNGGMFYAGFSAFLDSDVTKDASESYGYDGMVGFRYAGLDARVFGYIGNAMSKDYGPGKKTVTTDYFQDISGFNLELDYALNDMFDFSAGFGLVTFEENSGRNGDIESMTYHVAAGFQANERTYFAAGATYLEADPSKSNSAVYQREQAHSIYTNVTYALHKNAKVYAEIGIADRELGSDEQQVKDLGYLLGMEVTF